ncbi:endonuclease [candidate division WWE3 bacterium CG_4_9_14_3_um_filter_39_7]|uniref:Endonuclease n=1 Tax=candidate division WWE3 bacterium CG_4_9_14_3_um_filter_39_7 TaxID=1975080 RepID=A0A2M7X0W4_UNCKA|nr:MAG: endonuclease [candidate division WWE3 bacterium CG_4_9_14_3_um_filter_39_7]
MYIIKSTLRNWYYVGMTQNLENRLKRHNSGWEKTTRSYRPFDMIYCKIFETRADARDYEKWLKVRSNKERVILKDTTL